MICQYCKKAIYIDLEGDWVHSKPNWPDSRVCGHIDNQKIATPTEVG